MLENIKSTILNVLIVPLWNWNLSLRINIQENKSFNRTFMELKFLSQQQEDYQYTCFNRTFMELK